MPAILVSLYNAYQTDLTQIVFTNHILRVIYLK